MTVRNINLIESNVSSGVTNYPTFIATFDAYIDDTSATNANFILVRDYDNTNIPLTITADGKIVAFSPISGNIGTGTTFKLSITTGLKSTGNLHLLSQEDRTFTTVGGFVPPGQIAYWNFEKTAFDQVGNFYPMLDGVIDLTYVTSYNTVAGTAGYFNGTSTLVRIPYADGLINQNDFTLSFWMKADSSQHGQSVMGLAGTNGFEFEISKNYDSCRFSAQYRFANDSSSGSEDLTFAGDGLTKDNGGWMGCTFCQDLRNNGGVKTLLAGQWAQIICTFNSTTKVSTIYINGSEMKAQDFNLWPSGNPAQGINGLMYAGDPYDNVFVFGSNEDITNLLITKSRSNYSNLTLSYFKGLLDDVRIYNRALTANEVTMSYKADLP